MYINMKVPINYMYCTPANCSKKNVTTILNVGANLCNNNYHNIDRIKYNSITNNYRIFTSFLDGNASYMGAGSGKFVNDKGDFEIKTYQIKNSTTPFQDIAILNYNEALNFKNVQINYSNGTISYFITKNDNNISESCNLIQKNPNINKIYDVVSIDNNFKISNDQHSIYNKAEGVFRNRILTSNGKNFGLNKLISFNYQALKLKNTDNIFFINFNYQPPFYKDYLYSKKSNLTNALIKDLQITMMNHSYMNLNPNSKDFFILPISMNGHITVTINNNNTYLADWSRFHYRDVNKTGYYNSANRKLNIFGFIPSSPLYDSDGLEYIKQNKTENILLLNDKRLQKGGNCAYWAAETVIYINNKFRKMKNVLKAFGIGEAQIEIATRVTDMIDGTKKANGEQNVELAVTFTKPNNISNYNRFTSFNWDKKEKEVGEKDVFILKDPNLTFSVNTTSLEQMLLQIQKEVYSKWILNNDSDIQYLTSGFFGFNKKLEIQKKAKTGELELEIAEDILLTKTKKGLHSGIISVTSDINLIDNINYTKYEYWHLKEEIECSNFFTCLFKKIKAVQTSKEWYIIKDKYYNSTDQSINTSRLKNNLKKKGGSVESNIYDHLYNYKGEEL